MPQAYGTIETTDLDFNFRSSIDGVSHRLLVSSAVIGSIAHLFFIMNHPWNKTDGLFHFIYLYLIAVA